MVTDSLSLTTEDDRVYVMQGKHAVTIVTVTIVKVTIVTG